MVKDNNDTNDVKTQNTGEEIDRKISSSKPWFIAFIVLIVMALIVSIGLLFTGFRRHEFINERRGDRVSQTRPMMRGRRTVFINNTSASTNNTFAEGVVTSVGNNTFVVGGNGSSTTINTNGDTTWNTTDKKVSTNDTVVVTGTKSNSTITATDVSIVNQ